MNLSTLYTRKQLAAKYPAVTEIMLKTWNREGKLPCYRPGGRIALIDEMDLLKMIESSREGATA